MTEWLETLGLALPFLAILASWIVGGLKVARDEHGVFSWYAFWVGVLENVAQNTPVHLKKDKQ